MSSGRRKRNPIKPIVDVVLPVYGQPEFLRACLESFYAHDPGVTYSITLVDDVSTEPMDDVFQWAETQGANVVRHRRNQGFAAACNTGARKGKAPWILLLNTDTLVLQDGWLARLVEEGNRDPQTGVVGCLLTFFPKDHPLFDPKAALIRPPGATQHAGVAFDILGRPYHIFVGWPADHPKVRQRREMNAVTGACFLARRRLWLRLGGMDEDYTRGNFEDIQFCIQARLAGYKVVYTPEVELRHFAGGSNNTQTAKRNAQLFQIKSGNLVEYDEWRFW